MLITATTLKLLRHWCLSGSDSRHI